MLKKVALVLAATSVVTSAAFAAPMTDYSQGKFAIDISTSPSLDQSAKPDYYPYDYSYPAKSTTTFGVTAGLGGKWAVQYRQHKFSSEEENTYYYGYPQSNLKGYEANALYKVDKNFSVFAGYTSFKLGFTNSYYSGYDNPGKSVGGMQVGAIVSTPVTDKVSAYGIVSTGSKLDSFEVGMAYKVSKNVDFNMGYADRNYKKLHNESSWWGTPDHKYNAQAKGINWGVTLKFE